MMFPTINRASNFYFLIDPNTEEVGACKNLLAKDLTDQQRFTSKI